MEKIKIEKGTVQETLLIPLYGRKYAMDLYPDLFMDHDCQALFDRIDFTVPDNMKGMLGNIGCIMGATRQKEWSGHISSAVKQPISDRLPSAGQALWFYYKYSFPLSGSIKNVPDHRIRI